MAQFNYLINIKDSNGNVIPFDTRSGDVEKNSFRKLEVFIDTVEENVNDRASRILNKLTLQILINEKTKDRCKMLMDWALETASSTVHRTVIVEVTGTSGEDIRRFELGRMFVEDYMETYTENEECMLTLKLIQKAGHGEEFKHDDRI